MQVRKVVTGQLPLRYPLVSVDPNPIWVQRGNIDTSAVISAGVDLALEWVQEDHGGAESGGPNSGYWFSASLAAHALGTKAIHEWQAWRRLIGLLQ